MSEWILRGCDVERSRQRSECRKLRHRSRGWWQQVNVLNESLLVPFCCHLFSIFYFYIAFAFRSSFCFIFFSPFLPFPCIIPYFLSSSPSDLSHLYVAFLYSLFSAYALFFLTPLFPFPESVHFFFSYLFSSTLCLSSRNTLPVKDLSFLPRKHPQVPIHIFSTLCVCVGRGGRE